jgi:glycogen(starch) synthase
MRILHLSWEYPPVVYGGLGRHVHALAHAQAANGHDVVVITQAYGHDDDDVDLVSLGWQADPAGGVRVVRTAGGSDQVPQDLLGHVSRMQEGFAQAGDSLLDLWSPDVVHAHDWMVAHAAAALRRASGAALVATIHATEAGRNRGWITTELSTAIHAFEWWLANTADGVVACSRHMADEVETLFGVTPTRVIPNGIDPADWRASPDATARVRAENSDATALLAYTGRVEWEKGVQTLLEALPRVQRVHPGVRVLVAGRGSYLGTLQAQAAGMGLGDSAQFLGWVSEERLRAVVSAADVAIVPSFYEPFGLVALEAAALGAPVIVARTGGLAEFAADGLLAATFRPGDAYSLAEAITRDLAEPQAAAERARRAQEAVEERYGWRQVARTTVDVYALAASAVRAAEDDPRRRAAHSRASIGVPPFVAPLGQLMDAGW